MPHRPNAIVTTLKGQMCCRVISCIAVTSAAWFAGPAAGQDRAATYPTRAIRFVVPSRPGGTIDTIVRSLSEPMSTGLGQPIIVDYRAGAGGVVGMTAVARSAPDGYTMGLGQVGPNAIAPSIQQQFPYDPIADFQAVSMVAEMPLILMVNRDSHITSLKEFVAQGKSRPEGLTYGSTGIGSFSNVTGELFAKESGAKLVHVPFKAAPEAVQELLSGRLDATLSTYTDISQHIKSGKLQALAITSAKRNPLLPDVPTVAELGYPGLEAVGWFGVFLPARTPKPIVDKIHDQTRVTIRSWQRPMTRRFAPGCRLWDSCPLPPRLNNSPTG
jgi:tripartite-type tricarboxylate transporter receptor subunit TctC